jgi:DNA modification methylase
MLALNQIYQGNCLEVMKSIEDKSIDLILTDLPYNVTQQAYDVLIDFKLLWEQYQRLIKDNGAMIFTAVEPFRTKLIVSNLNLFKYDLIWEKNKCSGFLNAKKQPLRQHESILIFYKKPPVYNAQMTIGHKAMNTYTQHTISENYGKYNMISGGGSTERYPTSIIKIPVVNNDSKDRYHPAQKPVALGEYLIKTYTNENDVVLDNCCGSGSFLLAAKNLNRKFIGIELDEKYVEISKQRLGI